MVSTTQLIKFFVVAVFFVLSTSQVIELSSKNWNLVDTSDLFMVAFTAPWCGHCKSLKPEFYKAAESLGGVVNMGNVNCDDEKELAGKFDVKGFPTIKIFSKGRVIEDYQRGRDANSIVTDLMSRFNNLPDSVKIFKSKADIDASPKPLALLFTSKKSVPPMFKSLSLDLKNIGFGVVYDEAVAKEFEVSTPPKIIILHEDQVSKYEGELKRPKIFDFLKEFNEKKKEVPVEKPFEVESLTDKNIGYCDNMCVIGCSADKNELTEIAKKYRKDKLRFLWVNSVSGSAFCGKFGVSGHSGTDLIVLRAKKLKYATFVDATLVKVERFFENVLYGGVKFENLESLPSLKKNHDEL